MLHEEFEAVDPAEYAEFHRANWDAVTGVERQAAVAARMTEALRELAGTVGAGVGLAVSHGAAIRTAAIALLGWPPDHALDIRGLDNCAWVVLRREFGAKTWRLVAYNRTVA